MERLLPHLSREEIAVVEPLPEPEIHYPDSDGKPMGENDWQREWIVRIIENLKIVFLGREDVYVSGDLFWYPVKGNNREVTAPDATVVFGRPPQLRRCYKQWEEEDIPPAVVFEVWSPSNTAATLTRLLRFYNRHGVRECYVYDPASNEFLVYLRTGEGTLGERHVGSEWTSPLLGIHFRHSPSSFEIFRPDGSPFETVGELYSRAEEQRRHAEEQRRLAEEQRRHAEEQRRIAKREHERSRKLEQRLRDLGVEPDSE